LNQYDYTKQFEYYAKKPQHGTTMSCVPPSLYAPRFKDFMSSILVEDPKRFIARNPSLGDSLSEMTSHNQNDIAHSREKQSLVEKQSLLLPMGDQLQ